jgi:Phage tail tube protein
MTKFIGRRGSLGVALESSRGVAVAPAFWIPFVTMSFADKIEGARESQGMGNIADSDSFYVTMRMGEGNVDAQLYDYAIPYILSSLLGAVPNTTGSNPYTHTFTLSAVNQAKSLTLYWKDPDRSYAFPLAVVDSFKMTVEPNGIVNYTIGFKSKGADDYTSQTPAYTTMGSKFLHQHLLFKLATNTAGIAAASAISLKSLELNINRNAIFDQVIGTSEPEDILSQPISVEGNLSLNLEDDTYRNYMLNNTYRAMQIKLLASANSSLDLQFPRVDFSEWEPDFSLNDIAKQKINFKANYDSANAAAIITTATVINTKSSY